MNTEPMTEKYKLNVKPPNMISLIVLTAFASMGAALITPALPAISHYFNISTGHAQLTVTSFLLGYAIGQLIYGPIANRLGRKPAFYIGITVATIGSIFSILSSPADSFALMILGRLLEALGSSVGLVVCFTIINDFYFPSQSRRMVGFMSLAFAIVPGIAIAVGGLLTEYFHWQLCFFFLLAYGLFLIIPAVTLPETIIKVDPKALNGVYLLSGYKTMFKNRKLMAYSFIYGLTAASIYIFCAEGPMIGIKHLHYAPGTYGLIGLIPYSGAILGSFITIHFSKKYSGLQMLRLGIAAEVTGTILMFTSFLLGFVNIVTLIAPMIIFMMGHALLCANAATLGINESEDKANASAVVNFTAVGTGVVGTFILSMLHSHDLMVLPTIFVVAMLGMVLIYYFEVNLKSTLSQ
jgi:DHA1 family bicyclomycin/chloramphenicol resistance-like MFS transporter